MESLYSQALQLTPHRHGVLGEGAVSTGMRGEDPGLHNHCALLLCTGAWAGKGGPARAGMVRKVSTGLSPGWWGPGDRESICGLKGPI